MGGDNIIDLPGESKQSSIVPLSARGCEPIESGETKCARSLLHFAPFHFCIAALQGHAWAQGDKDDVGHMPSIACKIGRMSWQWVINANDLYLPVETSIPVSGQLFAALYNV